jgi:hypothetical protein
VVRQHVRVVVGAVRALRALEDRDQAHQHPVLRPVTATRWWSLWQLQAGGAGVMWPTALCTSKGSSQGWHTPGRTSGCPCGV